MHIYQRIRSLRPGQVAILVLAAVAAAAGLLSVRSTVAGKQHARAEALNQLGIDVRRELSDRESKLEIEIGQRDLFDPRFKDSMEYDSLERQMLALRSLMTNAFAQDTLVHERWGTTRAQEEGIWEESRLQQFSLNAVIVAICLSLLSALWVWFGGQQRTQVAPAEASVAPDSPPSARALNWSRLRANPVIRLVGWLLLILIGIVVFRIAEEVALAIRSAL